MKKFASIALITGVISIIAACEKEQPAKNVEGNYTGYLSGTYDGDDTLNNNYPVYTTATSKNQVKIESTLFPSFEVLVTQKGINVVPVSSDNEVYEFLYQGALKELSFKYYKNGDSTSYVGTKP